MRTSGVVVATLFLAGPTCVLAQELHGRVRETWQDVSDTTTGNESLLQNYEITFKNYVAPNLFWQARLRALIQGFETDGGPSTDTDLLEPFLQVVYEGPMWQASGGTRVTRVSTDDPVGGLDRERRDYFGRLGWFKEDRPRFDWALSRIDLQEGDIDTTLDDRSLLTMSYGSERASTAFGLDNRHFQDRTSGFERTSYQASWNGDVSGAFAAGDALYSAQALLVEGATRDESPGTLPIEVARLLSSALFVVDTTPSTGILAGAPALNDGNLTTPVADLSGDFRNIGGDLGFPEAVDAVFVYVERRLLPGNGAEYRWDVYTSADGDFWTQHAIALAGRFDDLEVRFEIRFTSVTARFVKVVNTLFSPDEPPLAITEVQLLGQEIRTGTERRDESRRSVNGTLAWHATEVLDFGLTTLASRLSTEAERLTTEEDLNNTLTTTVRGDRVVTTVRLQAINRNATFALPERDRIASFGLAFAPLPTFDLSFNATHRRNHSNDIVLIESNAVTLRAAARFLNATEATLDLGYVHQEDGLVNRVTTRHQASLGLYAPLRPGLIFSGNYVADRINFGGFLVPQDRTDLDLRSRLSYRPTRVFGATFEYLYQDLAGLKGGSTLWDLDWLPFPGGALQLQFRVVRDHRSLTGEVRDETRVGARWTLNPRTLLDMAYAVIESGDPSRGSFDLTTVFLEFRF